MPVRFAQVWENSGLDVGAKPDPAMIVPLGGANVIRMFDAPDMSLFEKRGILEIKKLDSSAVISERMLAYSVPMAIAALSVDAGYLLQLRLATDVALVLAGKPQFFQITGKGLGGSTGTLVRVARNSESLPEAWLRVVVLKPRPLKLSIRPVQVRDGQGKLVLHCKKNFDTKVLLNRVNAIWRPQANLVFEPGLSDPAPMDDEAAIAKMLGDGSTKAPLPQIVEFDAFESMFKGLRDPKASFTIFLVERVTHGGNTVYGVTSTKGGFALVSDSGRDEDMKTMAHEIGHYFGTLAKGSLYDDDVSSEDLLMCPGTEGTKVPFKDVIKYFNTNYK